MTHVDAVHYELNIRTGHTKKIPKHERNKERK